MQLKHGIRIKRRGAENSELRGGKAAEVPQMVNPDWPAKLCGSPRPERLCVSASQASTTWTPLRGEYLFTLAQITNLSVSVEIVAGSDDFAERGSVSRSNLGATAALDLSKRWATGNAPAGHRPALLWLRLRRALLYRRFVIGGTLLASGRLQVKNLRYRRPQVCATGAASTLNSSKRLGEGEPSVAHPTVNSVFDRKLDACQTRLLFALAMFILVSMFTEADDVGLGPPISVSRDLAESTPHSLPP